MSSAPATPVEQQPGAAIGPYKLERTLGAGGMGEVWFARRADGLFEAPVALKLLHAHLAASSVRNRFVREGRILGQLTHPNVAHLLDAGVTPRGQLYLAIEYVEGVALDCWCDDKRQGVTERVRLFLQVCEAVAHAHAHLIVHRDLKPSNILVTPEGNIKLLDFGIAKLVESTEGESVQTELTRMGGRVLTPEYAAPEQITNQPVTVTTDVYSLGVLLYVLLSGCRPYGKPGQSLSQLEREVLETEPEPVSRTLSGLTQAESAELAAKRGGSIRSLKESLKGDLDVIVAKALKKKPEERYPSVPALADDLRRYLANEPVQARPDSIAYRTRKYVRRHRLGVAIVSMLAIGLVVSTKLYLDARAAELQAEKETAQAKALSDFLQWDVLSSINSDTGDTRALTAAKALLDSGAAKINERLANQPLAAMKLREAFAVAYGNLGFPAESVKLDHESVEQAKRLIDAEAPEALDVAVALTATTHISFNESQVAYEMKVYGLATKQWPLDDVRRLWVETDTANLLMQRGDYEGALRIRKLIETGIKTADQSADDFESLRSSNQAFFAVHYWKLGELGEAERRLRAALDELLHAVTPLIGEMSGARVTLAEVLMDSGWLAEAESLLTTAAKDLKEHYDSKVGGLLQVNVDLGILRSLQGRYAEAQALADPALAREIAVASIDATGDQLRIGDVAAYLYSSPDRLDAAATTLRGVIDLDEKAVPMDSLDLARARTALVCVLLEQGHAPEANEQMKLIPATTLAKLEIAAPDRIKLRRVEGLRLLAEGRRDEALAKLGEALLLSQKTYTDKGPWTIRLRRELGEAKAGRT